MAAATLDDINAILTDTTIQNRVRAAMCKTAVNIKNEGVVDNHAERLALAKQWLLDINGHADEVQKYVIAAFSLANATADSAAIIGMTDTELQNQVDASVSVFIAG